MASIQPTLRDAPQILIPTPAETDIAAIEGLLRVWGPHLSRSQRRDAVHLLRDRIKSTVRHLQRAPLPLRQSCLERLHAIYRDQGPRLSSIDGKAFRRLVEGIEEVENTVLERGAWQDLGSTDRAVLNKAFQDIRRYSPDAQARQSAEAQILAHPMPKARQPVRKEKVPQATLRALGIPPDMTISDLTDTDGTTFAVSNARCQGGYGKFRIAISRHGNVYAVKEFRTEEAGAKEGKNKHDHRHTHVTQRINMEMELQRITNLSTHMRIKRVINWHGKVYALMTLMEGEVGEAIEALPQAERLALARSALTQMALELRAMHAKGIVHGDVKLHNALWDREGRVALADFGFALPMGDDGLVHHPSRGSYMPPEMLDHNTWNATADTWGLGACIADAFAEGRNPLFFLRDKDKDGTALHLSVPLTSARMHAFGDWRATLLDAQGHVVPSRLYSDITFSPYFSEFAQKDPALCAFVLERMLDPDPATRATMDEVVTFAQNHQTEADIATAQHALVQMARNTAQTPVVEALRAYHSRKAREPAPPGEPTEPAEPEPEPGPIWPMPKRWPWQH